MVSHRYTAGDSNCLWAATLHQRAQESPAREPGKEEGACWTSAWAACAYRMQGYQNWLKSEKGHFRCISSPLRRNIWSREIFLVLWAILLPSCLLEWTSAAAFFLGLSLSADPMPPTTTRPTKDTGNNYLNIHSQTQNFRWPVQACKYWDCIGHKSPNPLPWRTHNRSRLLHRQWGTLHCMPRLPRSTMRVDKLPVLSLLCPDMPDS